MWRHGLLVIINEQFHSTKPELRFCAGSNPTRGVSEVSDGENLLHWLRLKMRVYVCRRSTIPKKQLIIIEIMLDNNKIT